MNPKQREELAKLMEQASKVPGPVRALIGRMALDSQKSVNRMPYYSKVRFQAVITPGPPVIYTFTAAQTSTAFSYGRTESMASAGFPAAPARVAGFADTNLIEGGKTKDGEEVEIYGLSCVLDPLSEGVLARRLWATASVVITRKGGEDNKPLGNLNFLPSMGGLIGSWRSDIREPELPASTTTESVGTNAWPVNYNFWPLPDPIIWKPSGKTDSTFQVVIQVEVAQTFTSPPRIAAAGVAAFAPPTVVGAVGTFVDFWIVALNRQSQGRSVND